MSGDLELIENEFENSSIFKEDYEATDRTESKNFVTSKHTDRVPKRPESTAEHVKKKLETQLKSIIKKTPRNQLLPVNGRLSSISKNETIDLKVQSSDKNHQILKQIDNHSFKDINLIKIESSIEPSELKDPIATAESKIPVLKTRYSVNVLKKPYSMKWLRNRRVTLFLHSEFYSEFKIAMVLAQFALFNNESIIFIILS